MKTFSKCSIATAEARKKQNRAASRERHKPAFSKTGRLPATLTGRMSGIDGEKQGIVEKQMACLCWTLERNTEDTKKRERRAINGLALRLFLL